MEADKPGPMGPGSAFGPGGEMPIHSRTNENVKRVRRLLTRRERDRTGLFLIEGARLVREALEVGAEIVELIAAPEALDAEARATAEALREQCRVPVLEVTREVLAAISPRHSQQGLAAVARQRWERLEQVGLGQETCWAALRGIDMPGSLGTILRISDAVGGAGAILMGSPTDPYDPAAVRASLGAVLSQRLVRAGLEEFAAWKRREGAYVVGTSPAGPQQYTDISYPRPVVVLAGSERVGLSPEEEAVCDAVVRIPMAGRVESHHVAVALAIVLYEAFGQQRRGAR